MNANGAGVHFLVAGCRIMRQPVTAAGLVDLGAGARGPRHWGSLDGGAMGLEYRTKLSI